MRSPAKLRDAIFEIRNGGTWKCQQAQHGRSEGARRAAGFPTEFRHFADDLPAGGT